MFKTHLTREIDALKKRILELGAEVERSLETSFEAFNKQDLRLAEQVLEYDREIDEHEVGIEEECLKIMALYQPVAADLRMVVSILKINNDLERLGDLAANIAEYVQEIVKHGKLEVSNDFRRMYEETRRMVRDSLDALVNADPKLAIEVCQRDDVVDELNVKVIRAVQEQIRTRPDQLEMLLFLVSVSRSFERIGDYATNIAKDVYYMVRGTIIRHHVKDRAYLPSDN